MAVLSWMSVAGVALVTGCYSPELRDCAVSCVTSADCAPDQVCGTDRMCASRELAGRCAGQMPTMDAAVATDSSTNVDAPMVDAAPPVDASTLRFVRIELNGSGGVTVPGIGMCHHTAQPCTLTVMEGMLTTLQAVPDLGHRFDKWESGPCPGGPGQPASCSFVPGALVTDVKVKFRQGEDD